MAPLARTLLPVCAAALLLTGAGTSSAAAPVVVDADAAALAAAGVRDIIVTRRPGLSPSDRGRMRREAGVRRLRAVPLPGAELVRAGAGDLEAALDRLEADPDVVHAEPDLPVGIAAADAYRPLLWGFENTGQTVLGRRGTADADIDAPEAWTHSTGSGQVVAVVDTGVDLTHPDLAGRIAVNPGESGGGRESNGVDDDGNGYVDDWHGWDFSAGDGDPTDEHGHGTHVAGTIAAVRDNGIGIAGVAPDAKLLVLRALDENGEGSLSDIIDAFDYAGDMGVPVVNASLGGPGRSAAMRSVIAAHPGTLYVVAAGNDGSDNDAAPETPCSEDAPNLVCVAASDEDDSLAGFSNHGAGSVDLAAPGTSILSTLTGGQYAYMDGTSMASPHVAGAAALAGAAAPGISALAVRSALLGSVDPVAALDGEVATGGRLNANQAVLAATAGPEQEPEQEPDPEPDPGPGQQQGDGGPAAPPPAPAPAPAQPLPTVIEPPSPATQAPAPLPAPETDTTGPPSADRWPSALSRLRLTLRRGRPAIAFTARRTLHVRVTVMRGGRWLSTRTLRARAGGNRVTIFRSRRLRPGHYVVSVRSAQRTGAGAPLRLRFVVRG